MQKLIKGLAKLIAILIGLSLFWEVNWVVEVENASPDCCGKKAEFQGHQLSLFQEVFFYQCSVCKKTFVVHNPHKGISFKHLWGLMFCPKSQKDAS